MIFSSLYNSIKFSQIMPYQLWFDLLVALFVLSFLGNKFFNVIFKKQNACSHALSINLALISHASLMPFILFIFSYICYCFFIVGHFFYPEVISTQFNKSLIFFTECIILFYFVLKLLNLGQAQLLSWLSKSHHMTSHILIKIIGNSFQATMLLVIVNIIIPELKIDAFYIEILNKIARVFLIGVIGWIYVQILDGLEQLILNKIQINQKTSIHDKKINTQVRILKKSILIVSFFIIAAAMLMVFDSVRNLGAGLLTTAGIIGAAGAFASQRSLAGLFSGLKIAFTQPISIGDSVIIENESGQVEEITFSYVVIKLWDLRRLILPTDYFTNKSILNLTRYSTELLGTIYFYVDYTIPIDVLREHFKQILDITPLWDKKASAFEITDLKEQSIEIRALVSARNSTDLWKLRCEIREQLLKFIVEHFSYALPKTRQSLQNQ